MADDRIHAARGNGVVLMGSAINRSFISAHFLLSAYFLTVQTYKRMRLITRVYGNRKFHSGHLWPAKCVLIKGFPHLGIVCTPDLGPCIVS